TLCASLRCARGQAYWLAHRSPRARAEDPLRRTLQLTAPAVYPWGTAKIYGLVHAIPALNRAAIQGELIATGPVGSFLPRHGAMCHAMLALVAPLPKQAMSANSLCGLGGLCREFQPVTSLARTGVRQCTRA